MADFETETELQIAVNERSLREAGRTIESGLPDPTVSVEATPDTRAMRPDGGAGAVGGGVGQSMIDLQSEQVELLESIDDSLEGMVGAGGGGGGGLPIAAPIPPKPKGGGGGIFRTLAKFAGGLTMAGGAAFMADFLPSPDPTDDPDRSALESGTLTFGLPPELGNDLFGGALDVVGDFLGGPESGAGGQFSDIPNSPFNPPGAGGEGVGGGPFDMIDAYIETTDMLMTQTPGWIEELAALAPPERPDDLPDDPAKIGSPEGIGGSGGGGDGGARGPGNCPDGMVWSQNFKRCVPANGGGGGGGGSGGGGGGGGGPTRVEVSTDVTIEDRRDIEQAMERAKQEAIRDVERRMNQGMTEI